MYQAKRKFEWEQTARLCSMWASGKTSLADFMPKELVDKAPVVKLDGREAMKMLEQVFGGKQ